VGALDDPHTVLKRHDVDLLSGQGFGQAFRFLGAQRVNVI
jgi:hypothetical protein